MDETHHPNSSSTCEKYRVSFESAKVAEAHAGKLNTNDVVAIILENFKHLRKSTAQPLSFCCHQMQLQVKCEFVTCNMKVINRT